MVHVQRAGQVNGDELVPLGRLGLGEGTKHVPPRVVHEHVDWSELRLRHRDSGVHTGSTRDVAIESFCSTAGLLDIRSDFTCRFMVEVENGNTRPLATKSAAGSPDDAAATTRDDNCLILEPLHDSSHSG